MNKTSDEKSHLQTTLERLKSHFERSSGKFTAEKQDELKRAFESLQFSADLLEGERDAVARMGQNLERIDEEMPSNIIPFRRQQTPAVKGFSRTTDRRWILRIDCLIESLYISEIHKMAMELHSHSRRYAFVEFRDIQKESRSDADELMKLGGISLFVPSILDLTPAEQCALLQITSKDTIHRPLLMVGSSLPYSELRCEAGVNADLLACLARAYIKLTRPFHEYKEQGLIQYFLDSLETHPT